MRLSWLNSAWIWGQRLVSSINTFHFVSYWNHFSFDYRIPFFFFCFDHYISNYQNLSFFLTFPIVSYELLVVKRVKSDDLWTNPSIVTLISDIRIRQLVKSCFKSFQNARLTVILTKKMHWQNKHLEIGDSNFERKNLLKRCKLC